MRRTDRQETHPVHQSLLREPRYFGVGRGFLVMEVCFLGAGALMLGFQWATLAMLAAIVFGVHPLMMWVTARDLLMPAFVLRHLLQQPYYPPQARFDAPARRVFRALPER